MEQQNLIIKNTFLDISTEDDADHLPRAFSDQSHARIQPRMPVSVLASSISPIEEEGSDSLSDPVYSQPVDENDFLHSLRTISRPETMNFPIPSLFSFVPINVPPATLLRPIEECRWHEESTTMGSLSKDGKTFTKLEFDGRLSMITNDKVFDGKVHRFMVHIESGPLSVADGFGFVFSPTLPCKKNIQKIESIFVSKKGKICSRIHNELETLNERSIGTIEVGSLIELIVDLESLVASFTLYCPPNNLDPETLAILVRDQQTLSHWQIGSMEFTLKDIVKKTGYIGYFCAVLKNKSTTLRFL